MATDPTTNFASWAAQTAPYLGFVPGGSFVAPLAAIAGAVSGGIKPQVRKPEAEETAEIQIGTEKDYGPNIGTKVYTGPKYGFQTIDTAQTMNPEQAAVDPTAQAEFRRVQQVLRERFAPPAKPETKRPVDVDKRTPETRTDTGIGGQGGAQQTTDPQINDLIQMLKGELDPERVRLRSDINLQEYVRRALINEALGARSRRELTKRQVELKNIEAWRDLEQTRMEANTRQSLAFGSAIAASMVPNQGLGSVLNAAYANAMAPFQNFTLK